MKPTLAIIEIIFMSCINLIKGKRFRISYEAEKSYSTLADQLQDHCSSHGFTYKAETNSCFRAFAPGKIFYDAFRACRTMYGGKSVRGALARPASTAVLVNVTSATGYSAFITGNIE